ncbi:MAG: hypothetical protein AMXMBFR66_09960 [Pseudomonadota bacterium]|nr:hypothetical protein [Rubrivivax sp.]NLZ40549.1 hypothetical protein [Comamonadaceae bacterium]
MLRALLALAVAANALFFAWTQGWFAPVWPAPNSGLREPGRIGAQLRPETVVVLPAASAARALALACLESGPYGDAEIAGAVAALESAGLDAGSWQREQVQSPGYWAVFAGRPADAAARRARAEELQRLALPYEQVDEPAELAGGFVLSRHASQEAAARALAAIGAKASAGLRVVAVPAGPPRHWLRVPAANAEVQARLAALDRGFRPCAERP